MEYFTWKPEYSVGDQTLDDQHKELIKIMNNLYVLVNEPVRVEHDDQIELIFGQLAQYIVTHFSYEEQRMADAHFPDEKLAAHRAEHHELIKKVRRHQADVMAGNRDGLKELLPYLYGEWLIHHICEQDMEYRPFMQARQS